MHERGGHLERHVICFERWFKWARLEDVPKSQMVSPEQKTIFSHLRASKTGELLKIIENLTENLNEFK